MKEQKDEAFFSKELATIKLDVPIDFCLPKENFIENLNLAKTGEIFRKYEFRNLNERLQKSLEIANIIEEISKKQIPIENKMDIQKMKISVSVLNSNISMPTIDDILVFGKSIDAAKKNIEDEIKKYELGFVVENIEMPIRDILKEMTNNGFIVDVEKMKNLSKIFSKKASEIEKKVYEISGEEFNLKSTKQLSEVLFEKMEIPTKGLKKTPKGVVSTKESELVKLKGEYEIIDFILEYRELSKMLSTYIDNILEILDEENKIHPEFLQLGTSTGRMSSKNPNIQNIPTRGEYGKKIRECFISRENSSLVSFDYSQIELRVAAIMSQDKKFLEIFINDKDIHSEVAKDIFGKEDAYTRRKAKAINFGILYGMGATSLRKSLNEGSSEKEISLNDARDYLDKYFENFSGLAKFIEDTKNEVRQKGYSTTLFGRKRFFPEINSKIPFIKAMAERTAINAPIQGTATGDIIKIAMKKVDDFLIEKDLKKDVKFLAQVHDELIFEISDKLLEKIIPEIEKIMESILKNSDLEEKYKKVPLKVSGVTGKN